MKLKLLDLFCGAGGAAMGYHRAGFEVVGVDIKPQKHYPFEFHQGDAFEYLWAHVSEFNAIHVSPPCQAFTLANFKDRQDGKACHDNLIPDVRRLFYNIRNCPPWIIENVPQAPLYRPITLCGTMFDLGVFRHRCFETSFKIEQPAHVKHQGKIGDGKYFSIAGGGSVEIVGTVKRDITKGSAEDWRKAMDIDWMTRQELTQAIPPAYTEYIGKQLMRAILEVKIGKISFDQL